MPKKKTLNDVIIESRNHHGQKYDYSKSVYINTHTPICIICTSHNNEFWQAPLSHIKGITGCSFCILEKTKSTNLTNWGGHPMRDSRIRAKQLSTMVERHGVESPQQSEEIKAKTRETNLERYGYENVLQSPEIRMRISAINLRKYGYEYPMCSSIVHEKFKETCWTNLGVDYPTQSDIVRAKIKANNLEKIGYVSYHQLHMVDSLPLLQSTEWMIDQYIVQKKTLIQISKELCVGDACVGRYTKMHNIEIRPNEIGSSYQERAWIEGIMESEGIFIQYEGNGGQYKIPSTNWRADGYCKENNTIYEFHGSPWHGNPRKYQSDEYPHSTIPKTAEELYKKTKERERAIIKLGYNLVVMWDDGFNYNVKGGMYGQGS